MIKTSLVALATVAAFAGVAVPAMADTNDDSDNSYVRDAQIAQIELRQQGVPASSVDEWNGLWRAFVVNDDGTQSMKFFDKTTLAPITL
ncbi:hypothetical protein [Devosia nitrariae]|uniref:PepSY domain-containing protein n=1 Tax=Devosia nitrariae TaxID=2071872 RepID=A0ABQ5W7B6_9HYPH|nr:hypothetical protein [Devosia nitrariae]GLQ55982.1 hypothetical protein GCM10010862_32410 [Devosia nitrariae]